MPTLSYDQRTTFLQTVRKLRFVCLVLEQEAQLVLLLGSPVHTFVDDAFAARTALPHDVALGDTFHFMLGADPATRIRYVRTSCPLDTAARAFSEQWASMAFASRTTITNSHPFALRDAVPVSEGGERVNVMLRRPAALADLERDNELETTNELEVGIYCPLLPSASTAAVVAVVVRVAVAIQHPAAAAADLVAVASESSGSESSSPSSCRCCSSVAVVRGRLVVVLVIVVAVVAHAPSQLRGHAGAQIGRGRWWWIGSTCDNGAGGGIDGAGDEGVMPGGLVEGAAGEWVQGTYRQTRHDGHQPEGNGIGSQWTAAVVGCTVTVTM
ncbi:hypothetical protein EDB83DRAFT_2550979 [Lactarius deliciosus]|nr:hypothetical protein EDB83DRAFT_2550979 [Lactarius deliciosus]